jgi:DNA-binding CsgD family transcriptional regulator
MTSRISAEISANRGVKPNTTKAQLRSIFDKLGATIRIEAMREALKLGCISGDDDNLM